MGPPQLWVALCSDTEDNQPNYVPGWSKRGSNYDRNPAIVKWDWTEFWHDLSDYFHDLGIPITWLIRVDDGPVYDNMLRQFRNEILKLASKGAEIGIHIHTFVWDFFYSKWKQTRDPVCEARIVRRSIEYFKDVLGFSPLSVRMGWNAMSNGIMEILDQSGVMVDASAIPGNHCRGKFGGRDNFYEWRGAPQEPYHPSHQDYRCLGEMNLLEVPISTLSSPSKKWGKFVNILSNFKISRMLAHLSPLTKRAINPNFFFYISPWWSASIISRIVDRYVKKARENGEAFLVGFFHSSDILDPKKGCENSFFKQNINRVIEIVSASKGINVKFLTLSQVARQIRNSNS